MTTIGRQRLCGGTFFTLILQALRPRFKAREHYHGESDGLTDADVLIGLIKVVNPDYQAPKKSALKGMTNDFKQCKISRGVYLPLGDTAEVREFDNRVKTQYTSVLANMNDFVNNFLECGTCNKKDVDLVKALMELISQDEIADDVDFFILENGGKIKKTAISSLREVCLPAFLLGIWHYVVCVQKDNGVGKETYAKWCPPAGGAQRKYTSSIGNGIHHDVIVHLLDKNEIPQQDEPSYEESTHQSFEQKNEDTQQGSAQAQTSLYNNNPIFIQQNGNGNVVAPNYGTVTIIWGKNRG